MKRFLSHFKLRLSLSLFVIASAIITGCTLYMDDPDDLRVLRTESGYLEEEVIELPDGNGTITYKYNQKTIAITDEVEDYVVNVEDDSIVYFASSIPDYYLPEAGEMMTCSFREKFPDGFCHRCIDRSEVNGLYRCVFTKCSLADAFDELQINHVQPTGVSINGTDYNLTNEEFDSIMGDANSPEVMEARTRGDDSDDSGDSDDIELDERQLITQKIIEFPTFDCIATSGANNLNFSGKGSLGGNLIIKGYGDVVVDSKKGTIITTFDFRGSLNLWLKVEGALNVNLAPPDDIKITGFNFDLKIVGIKAGLFVKPYVKISQKLSGQINVGWKYRITCTLNQAKRGAFPTFKVRNKGCSSPDVTFNGEASSLTVEAGMDFSLQFGARMFDSSEETCAGVKFYGTVDVPIDLKKYQSAEAFQQQNENFPLYAVLYLKGTQKFTGVDLESVLSSPPLVVAKHLPIPIMPEVDKSDKVTTFYCVDKVKKKYNVKYKLQTVGIIGYLLNYQPYARIYDTNENLLKEFRITYKNLSEGESNWIDENEIIQVNTPYIVQIGLMSMGKYWLPLREINYELEDPGCIVEYGEIVRSLDAEKLSSEGSRFEPDYYSHKTFRYQYIIDVQMQINHPRSIGKWGFLMQRTDGGAPFYFEQTSKSDWSKMAMAYPTVRFYFYTNKEYDFNRKPVDIYLRFTGRYSHISNKNVMKFIDNTKKAVCLRLAYNNATNHSPLTRDEIKEFKSDPDNYDMLEDNIAKNPNFLYESHNQTYTSRIAPAWADSDDEVYVVGEVR